MSQYGFTVEVPEGYDEAVLRTRVALRSAGFSIITEAHVGGMLGPEAGSDRQYLIMGAYNAQTTQRDIDKNIQAAVHVPCNIVVQETNDSAVVAALDPQDDADPASPEQLQTASSARDALQGVLEKVASQ
jgi:uncharacterized protein (DUF302 family)